MNKKQFTKKEFNQMQGEVEKMKYQLSKIKKDNPQLAKIIIDQINPKTSSEIKLNALNSIIGYLVRKGADSNLPMEILIEIANDYEKRLSEN